MAEPVAPARSDTFLELFSTATLLWRVPNLVGYAEPPRYFWREVAAEGQPRYDVRVTIQPVQTTHSGKDGVLSQMDSLLGKVPKW
jgi:hypothetical protein